MDFGSILWGKTKKLSANLTQAGAVFERKMLYKIFELPMHIPIEFIYAQYGIIPFWVRCSAQKLRYFYRLKLGNPQHPLLNEIDSNQKIDHGFYCGLSKVHPFVFTNSDNMKLRKKRMNESLKLQEYFWRQKVSEKTNFYDGVNIFKCPYRGGSKVHTKFF